MRKFVLSAIVFGAVLLSPVALELTGTSVQVAVGTAQAQDTGTVTGCAKPACSLAEKIADEKGFVYNGWKVTRSVVNIILILGLLVISFSNITRISIDTYTIKKALPNLLIGIVLANASLFIIRYIADLATVVTYFFVELSAKLNSQVISGSLALENYTFKTFIADVTAKIGLETIINSTSFLGPGGTNLALIFMLLIGLIIVIGLLWLAALLYVRLAYVYLLTILAPIAFVAYGVPGMAKYFTQWWQMFTKWVFMLPAMAAVFWLMLTVAGSGQSMSTIQLILMFILFFTALTIPTKWGGAVMSKVSSGFQKYTGLEAGKKWAGDTAKNYGNLAIAKSPVGRIQEWAKLNKANMENRIKNARDLQSIRARRGAAGRLEGRLAGEAQGLADDLATVKAEKQEEFFATPEGQRILRGLIDSELKKRSAEAERDNQRLEMKIEYLNSEDADEKALVKKLYDNVFKQKRTADHLELEDGIAVGNVAFSNVEMVRAIEEADKHSKNLAKAEAKFNAMSAAEKSSAAGISLQDEIKKLRHAKKVATDTFDAMKGRDEYKEEFEKYRSVDDAVKEFNDPTSVQTRLWKATLSRGSKIVNEGISKQNEDIIKNGTAAEVTGMMDEFLGNIEEAFKTKADADKAKKLFMQGKTAEFQLMVDDLKKVDPNAAKKIKVRDGLLATEANKVLIGRTGDYRNEDIVANYINLHNTIGADNPAEKIHENLSTREGRNKAGRALADSSGSLSGPAASRPRATKIVKTKVAPTTPASAPAPKKPKPPKPPVKRAGFRSDENYEKDVQAYNQRKQEYEDKYGPGSADQPNAPDTDYDDDDYEGES